VGIEDVSTVSEIGQSPARLSIGTRIGPYEIVELLGAGGMGVVYRARDSRLGRDVAIKLIPSARQSADALKRFEIEARATGSINHPNILSVYDVGAGEYGPWLVAELLEGQSLRAALNGPQPVERALDYALQLANGLAAAHDHGVVHRDLKPENVFVTSDGRVKILDFGIAKFLADDAHPTATGKIIGTPAYMSPEQRAGGEIDRRTDIYSFGAILHELLTGQRAQQNRTLPANVPNALAKLVRDCMHEKPKDRPQSARDLVARLRSIRVEPPPRSRLSRAVAAAGVGLVVAASVLTWQFTRSRPVSSSNANAASIAVLPFIDLSPQKDQGYFSDGIAEEILNELAQVDGLRVIGRTSSFAMRDKTQDLRSMAQQLAATHLLEGSVRKAGSRVRITAQLIEAEGGSHLWSKEFDGDVGDVFAMQEKIARAVAEELRVKLMPAKGRPVRTANTEAYDLYLQAKASRQRGSADAYVAALSALQRAVDLDPGFSAAWALLGQAHYLSSDMDPRLFNEKEHRALALAAADKAIALAPDLPDGYVARAELRVFSYDWEGAGADIARARELGAETPELLHNQAFLLAALSRLPEAIETMQRAALLDPLSANIRTDLGMIQLGAGQFAAGEASAARALELAPENDRSARTLAFALLLQRRFPEALAAFHRSAIPLYVWMGEAIVNHSLGNAEEERRGLERLLSWPRALSASWQITQTYAWLGDLDHAFEWLDHAIEHRDPGLTQLTYDQAIRPLRSDPRYATALKRLKL
jgi:serine/threonine protein kinase/tetratricopeptide (TPR) repeat protein